MSTVIAFLSSGILSGFLGGFLGGFISARAFLKAGLYQSRFQYVTTVLSRQENLENFQEFLQTIGDETRVKNKSLLGVSNTSWYLALFLPADKLKENLDAAIVKGDFPKAKQLVARFLEGRWEMRGASPSPIRARAGGKFRGLWHRLRHL